MTLHVTTILKALKEKEVPQQEIDQIIKLLKPDRANENIDGIEPEPPLLSDGTVKFGAGQRVIEVPLKILGYTDLERILPKLIKWVMSIHKKETPEYLEQTHPYQVIKDVVEHVQSLDWTRLKLSVFEELEIIFSVAEDPLWGYIPIKKEFLVICPIGQIVDNIGKLVEYNHDFFTLLWGRTPLPVKHMISSQILGIMSGIEMVNLSVTDYVTGIVTAILSRIPDLNGGAFSIGANGLPILPETTQENPLPV